MHLINLMAPDVASRCDYASGVCSALRHRGGCCHAGVPVAVGNRRLMEEAGVPIGLPAAEFVRRGEGLGQTCIFLAAAGRCPPPPPPPLHERVVPRLLLGIYLLWKYLLPSRAHTSRFARLQSPGGSRRP